MLETSESPTFEEFAAQLQIEPRYHPLLRQALTHRSQSDLAPHGDNERLEFLGDSILGMLVNEYLYLAYPSASEGELTRMKANVVSEPSLAEAARELGLGPLVDLARGEEAGKNYQDNNEQNRCRPAPEPGLCSPALVSGRLRPVRTWYSTLGTRAGPFSATLS